MTSKVSFLVLLLCVAIAYAEEQRFHRDHCSGITCRNGKHHGYNCNKEGLCEFYCEGRDCPVIDATNDRRIVRQVIKIRHYLPLRTPEEIQDYFDELDAFTRNSIIFLFDAKTINALLVKLPDLPRFFERQIRRKTGSHALKQVTVETLRQILDRLPMSVIVFRTEPEFQPEIRRRVEWYVDNMEAGMLQQLFMALDTLNEVFDGIDVRVFKKALLKLPDPDAVFVRLDCKILADLLSKVNGKNIGVIVKKLTNTLRKLRDCEWAEGPQDQPEEETGKPKVPKRKVPKSEEEKEPNEEKEPGADYIQYSLRKIRRQLEASDFSGLQRTLEGLSYKEFFLSHFSKEEVQAMLISLPDLDSIFAHINLQFLDFIIHRIDESVLIQIEPKMPNTLASLKAYWGANEEEEEKEKEPKKEQKPEAEEEERTGDYIQDSLRKIRRQLEAGNFSGLQRTLEGLQYKDFVLRYLSKEEIQAILINLPDPDSIFAHLNLQFIDFMIHNIDASVLTQIEPKMPNTFASLKVYWGANEKEEEEEEETNPEQPQPVPSPEKPHGPYDCQNQGCPAFDGHVNPYIPCPQCFMPQQYPQWNFAVPPPYPQFDCNGPNCFFFVPCREESEENIEVKTRRVITSEEAH